VGLWLELPPLPSPGLDGGADPCHPSGHHLAFELLFSLVETDLVAFPHTNPHPTGQGTKVGFCQLLSFYSN
jgi:hypothetical protein